MSSGPPSGGGGGQAPPPEVQAELQALYEAQLDMIGRIVPGLPATTIQQAYQVASVQEEQLGAVWMELAEGPKPFLGVRLERVAGDGPPMTFYTPKKLVGKVTSEEFRNFMVVFGCLQSPMLRAILHAAGWRVQFAPSDGGPSKLIVG
jgi:hypothetical protein